MGPGGLDENKSPIQLLELHKHAHCSVVSMWPGDGLCEQLSARVHVAV